MPCSTPTDWPPESTVTHACAYSDHRSQCRRALEQDRLVRPAEFFLGGLLAVYFLAFVIVVSAALS